MIEIWKDIRGRRIDPRPFLQAELIERPQPRRRVLWGAPVAARRWKMSPRWAADYSDVLCQAPRALDTAEFSPKRRSIRRPRISFQIAIIRNSPARPVSITWLAIGGNDWRNRIIYRCVVAEAVNKFAASRVPAVLHHGIRGQVRELISCLLGRRIGHHFGRYRAERTTTAGAIANSIFRNGGYFVMTHFLSFLTTISLAPPNPK
jgi:hypothetical protein